MPGLPSSAIAGGGSAIAGGGSAIPGGGSAMPGGGSAIAGGSPIPGGGSPIPGSGGLPPPSAGFSGSTSNVSATAWIGDPAGSAGDVQVGVEPPCFHTRRTPSPPPATIQRPSALTATL